MLRNRIPEPDAEPAPGTDSVTVVTAPPLSEPEQDQPRGFGVLGGSGLPDTEAVSICMPVPLGEEAGGAGRQTEEYGPRTGHANGIGRSAANADYGFAGRNMSGYRSSSVTTRPDVATGRPGALDQEVLLETDTSDTTSQTANQERFVAAARAGEVADLEQLFNRSGVRVDGHVDEGKECCWL